MAPSTRSSGGSEPSEHSDDASSTPAAASVSSPSEGTVVAVQRNQQKRGAGQRRGHVKSRQGCFSCKRRRVKCDERRPICSPCKRLDLNCEFPPEMVPAPQAQISGMAMNHLRFYHRFLHIAYPRLPIKEDAAWQACAMLSHNYEHLAHGVLALGATHSTTSEHDYTPQALYHRTTAMRLVNEQLSNPDSTPEAADALLGTMICLTAQTAGMLDTFDEYITLVRGCNMVAQLTLMGERKTPSLWNGITVERHNDSLDNVVEVKPLDEETEQMVRQCKASLDHSLAFCQNQNEIEYHGLLMAVVDGILVADYGQFSRLFVKPALMDTATFNDFIRHDNWVAQALVVHMFLVDYLAGGYFLPESEAPKADSRKSNTIAWVRGVAQKTPKAYHSLFAWPLDYCNILEVKDGRNMYCP